MTWLELNDLVFTLLSDSGQRKTHEAYLKQQIRFAALDLQRFIPAYREGHETKIYDADLTIDGAAAFTALPDGAELKGVWVSKSRTAVAIPSGDALLIPIPAGQPESILLTVSAWVIGNAGSIVTLSFDEATELEDSAYTLTQDHTWELAHFVIQTAASSLRSNLRLRAESDIQVSELSTQGTYTDYYDIGATACEREATRHKAAFHPWEDRRELICGHMSASTTAAYAHNPRTGELAVWPAPVQPEGGYIIYKWDGKALNFNDEDVVPFDEMAVNAIYTYVRAKMLTDVDGERTEGWKLMNNYKEERTQLYAESNK